MNTIELLVAGPLVMASVVGGVTVIQAHQAVLNRRHDERALRDAKRERLRYAYVGLVGVVLDHKAAMCDDTDDENIGEALLQIEVETGNGSDVTCSRIG